MFLTLWSDQTVCTSRGSLNTWLSIMSHAPWPSDSILSSSIRSGLSCLDTVWRDLLMDCSKDTMNLCGKVFCLLLALFHCYVLNCFRYQVLCFPLQKVPLNVKMLHLLDVQWLYIIISGIETKDCLKKSRSRCVEDLGLTMFLSDQPQLLSLF